jgi:formamidopyrimidine-DNA glycosylase
VPELPEVETVVRGLRAAGVQGARIGDVQVRWPASVLPSPPIFAAALRGRRIARLRRRAKYIVAELDDGRGLLIHLRMTGKLILAAAGGEDEAPHDRVIITLDDGRRLHFNDTRKFGRLYLVDSPARLLAPLGPEPLEASFTPAVLRARLQGRRSALKTLLLDQRRLAGLGNIYTDEALWAARLHPLRRAGSLSPAEARRLHAAIRETLARAIRHGGTTLGDGAANFRGVAGRRGRHAGLLRVFRRHGRPCPRCGEIIRRLLVGGRATHVCPRCQPAPPAPPAPCHAGAGCGKTTSAQAAGAPSPSRRRTQGTERRGK